jgi:imidazole glycerol-phosphate synthase subunit HisF
MLTRRIIPCLDVRAGKVTKGVAFQGNIDVGDPVQLAKKYYEDGADEIVFYDITASSEKRDIMIDVVNRVAREIFIPFSVGGGLRTLADMRAVLLAGAEKVSIDSGAVRDPDIIRQGAEAFGNQCMVLSMQVKRVEKSDAIPSGFEIYVDGARVATGMDALEWSQRGVSLGAGELVLNSIDEDGVRDGYDVELTRLVSEAVDVPVIASGGAGTIDHIHDVFVNADADAAIIASMIHMGEYTIGGIKDDLAARGVPMRQA